MKIRDRHRVCWTGSDELNITLIVLDGIALDRVLAMGCNESG